MTAKQKQDVHYYYSSGRKYRLKQPDARTHHWNGSYIKTPMTMENTAVWFWWGCRIVIHFRTWFANYRTKNI